MERGGCIYIMMNRTNTTIYIGVTSDLVSRIQEHKQGIGSKFTAKYKCHKLVYYEFHESIEAAIAREKQLKNWHRAWKLNLIKEINPTLNDLYPDLMQEWGYK